MNRGDSASPYLVRRSRRPHGTSRNFMHENRETSETPAGNRCRSAGEGSGHTARVYVCEGSHCGIVPMNHSNQDGPRRRRVRREGCGSRRTLFHLTRTRLRAGLRVSHEWASVRPTDTAGRYSSEIRTGCANQRPSGSVRGALGNECPYRDQQAGLFLNRERSSVGNPVDAQDVEY
jgi:hypothetical protein